MSKKIPLQDLRYNLNNWISKTLSIPNPIFNNLPACPYAKKALLEDKVDISTFDSWVDAYTSLVTKDFDFDKLEVYIFAFPPDNITPNQLSNMLDSLAKTWTKDIIVLEDHPHEKEQVKEFNLNFSKSCLLLIQSRTKLNEARAYLESKGYYKNWTKEYKEAVHSR